MMWQAPTTFVYRCTDPDLADNLEVGRTIRFMDRESGIDGWYTIVSAEDCPCTNDLCCAVNFYLDVARTG